MKYILGLLLMSSFFVSTLPAATQVVTLPGKSPLVTIKIVFRTGSAEDPSGKEGLASLTASMIANGGSRNRTYKELVDALYPMAASVSSQVDKEMVTFTGVTHIDNLDAYYAILREMLLEPGWRADDLERLRDNQINGLRVSLRGSNDEELGKEVLYNQIYAGHPYGHYNAGTVSGLKNITIDDLQKFYKDHFTRANLIIGLAGGYPQAFRQKVEKDFEKLEKGTEAKLKLPAVKPPEGYRVTMIDKQTRSVAYSIGFPLDVKRGDPDYPALLVAQSYLGQHRNSGGLLYTQMRQLRGLNYGDYAYIEYFPFGMFMFEPLPNLARQQQIFQIWIRPVEPPTAHFALRLALYEFQKFLDKGLSQEDFEKSRSFLSKYANLLTKTKEAELGYAIDSLVYGIPDYNSYLKNALVKLTVADVNKAIKKHLQARNLDIVIVTDKAEQLKQQLVSNQPSPMTYNSPKPDEILAEDKTIEKMPLPIKADRVEIIPVAKVFE